MPFWSLVFVAGATDDLERLDHGARKRVLTKLDWLVEHFDAVPHVALGEEFRGLFKLRVGDVRVFYRAEYKLRTITVYYVGRRDKAYQ